MTEATEVENPVVAWLDKRKIKHRKMNGLGQRGWPDRLICLPKAPFWIEFKRPGEPLRKLQVYRIKQLRKLDYDIEVHDNAEKAIAAITRRLEAAQLSEKDNKVHARKRMCRTIPGSRIRKDKYKPSRS